MTTKNMYCNLFDRSIKLLGDKQNKLKLANIIIFGIGGVGGYVAECLIRAGVQNITIVDGDIIDVTNINRQIIALNSNIGEKKVDVMKARMLQINRDANIVTIDNNYNANTASDFNFAQYDFIIDCIDSMSDKQNLILHAHREKANIICSMGAGNRTKIPQICIADIHKTSYDKLAKILRKFCKENNIKKLPVAIDMSNSISTTNGVGSVVYYPMNMGSIIASYVINKLLEKE